MYKNQEIFTRMNNLEVLKINPYEIAKASDMDDAFKDIIKHLGVFASYTFAYHKPTMDDGYDMQPVLLPGDTKGERERRFEKHEGKKIAVADEMPVKDFIIGGGIVPSSANTLKLLPIIAYSKTGALYISNGKIKNDDTKSKIFIPNVELTIDDKTQGGKLYLRLMEEYKDNKEKLYSETEYQIMSVYIGDGDDFKDESVESGYNEGGVKNDDKWSSYGMEIRANANGMFKEYAKKQTQSIRLYALHGDFAKDFREAKAPDTPNDKIWGRRVKIAEVLLCFTVQDQNGIVRMHQIEKDDIHFVTATQYWRDLKKPFSTRDVPRGTPSPTPEEDKAYNKEQYTAKDAYWVSQVPFPASFKNVEFEEIKSHWYDFKKKLSAIHDKLADRAEHYNYRWTNEQTSTYSLGSVAETNERIHKIHKNDGSLKEEVITRENVYRAFQDERGKHSLRGEHLYIQGETEGKNKPQNINLQYEDDSKNKITIPAQCNIAAGFDKVGMALRTQRKDFDDEVEKRYRIDLILQDAINGEEAARIKDVEMLEQRIATETEERKSDVKNVRESLVEHEESTDVHGATSAVVSDRLMMRDKYGSCRVAISPRLEDDVVINIGYLRSQLSLFRQNLFPEIFFVKLVSSQAEFNAWVNYRGTGTAYKTVYLQGEFQWDGDFFDLYTIGTEEVIGIPDKKGNKPSINIQKKDGQCWEAITGNFEDKEGKFGKISNVNIYVKGGIIYQENRTQRLRGVYGVTCVDCIIDVQGNYGSPGPLRFRYGTDVEAAMYCSLENCIVKAVAGNGANGRDGANTSAPGEHGSGGAWAVAVSNCDYVKGCNVHAQGGNGGNGGRGGNGYSGDCSGDTGGNGGRGGNAYSAYKSNITDESFIIEVVIGGSGGDGGNGGTGINKEKGGNGGNGGTGGDIFVSGRAKEPYYQKGSYGYGGYSDDSTNPGNDGHNGGESSQYPIE